MRAEVTPVDVTHGPLSKYLVRYTGEPGCSSFVWFPASVSPELVEDLLNDALAEAAKCEECP